MENPATWGPAEKVVNDVLRQDRERKEREAEGQPVTVGLSLARRITDALRNAGLLTDPQDRDFFVLHDPAWRRVRAASGG